MPHAWRPYVQQSQTNIGTIDLALYTSTDPPAPTAPGQSVVTVPEHLAEASGKLLIHLLQIVEVPETVEDLDKEATEDADFTAEDLEALEAIVEEDLNVPIPHVIDGIHVNLDPPTAEIEDIIDDRRVGPDRLTFYLARSFNRSYYWFHSPSTDRSRRLRKLIGDYRHNS